MSDTTLSSLAADAEPGRTRRRHGDRVIHRAISDAIFEQRLPPGTKLAEDTLGDIFAVSRTVVRKALFQLVSDKLVEMRPNRGAVVAKPGVDEARDVFQARRVIEAACVAAAVPRLTDIDRAALADLIEQDRAAHDSHSRQIAIRLSGDFHLKIAEIAGNAVLAGYLRELIGRTSLIIGLYEPVRSTVCTFEEHADLLVAITGDDVEAAQRAMTTHLSTCEQRLGLDRRSGDIDLREIFADHNADP